jgi:hypothetical protein
MPSIYEAHVSLDQETWLWHRANPGQLSRLAKDAIRREIALELEMQLRKRAVPMAARR